MSRNRARRPILIEIERNGKKAKSIGCPYCKPSHELQMDGTLSPCGTSLSIQAVQNIYFERNLVCIVCGKTGGTLVKCPAGYKHIHDCYPGKKIFNKAPRLSKVAAIAWKLPKAVLKAMKINPIQVTDDKGKVLGYSFDKP